MVVIFIGFNHNKGLFFSLVFSNLPTSTNFNSLQPTLIKNTNFDPLQSTLTHFNQLYPPSSKFYYRYFNQLPKTYQLQLTSINFNLPQSTSTYFNLLQQKISTSTYLNQFHPFINSNLPTQALSMHIYIFQKSVYCLTQDGF